MPKKPPTTSDAASAATSRAAARSSARRRVKSAPAVIPRATSTSSSRDVDVVDGTDAVNDDIDDAANEVDVEGAAATRSYARAVAASSPVGVVVPRVVLAVVEYDADARRANGPDDDDIVERVVGATADVVASVVAGVIARAIARPSVDTPRRVHIARDRDDETRRRAETKRRAASRALERASLARPTDERTDDARWRARRRGRPTRALGHRRNTHANCLPIR